MDSKTFYDGVYDRDNPPGQAHGWLQWKGTDACIDLHCACGHHGHVDGSFFYYYECPECKAKYAVGANVKLIPLTEEEIAYVGHNSTIGFVTDEDEDEG